MIAGYQHALIVSRSLSFRPEESGLATLYHHLGIDTRSTTITDLNGRPQFLVEDHARPLAELV